MSLSFLYIAFVRILELLRLLRHDNGGLAVEVAVLRHEVAVLRPHLWVPKTSRPHPLAWAFAPRSATGTSR
jgi:hypothetical protein